MDLKFARLLVEGLVERLDADAASEKPQLLSTVSRHERQALRVILAFGVEGQEPSPASIVVSKSQSETPSITPVSDPADVPSITSSTNPTQVQIVTAADRQAQRLTDLKLDACSRTSDRDMILCVDFGTARSKAFAASVEHEDDPEPLMLELGLGKIDGDPDDVYSVSSSVWISDDGRLFAGAKAVLESASADGSLRKRLDSIKQELSLNDFEQDLSKRVLEKEINPTATVMSYEQALCFFLAHLTDLIGNELTRRGYSRYMKRRFTLPAWQKNQRRWAGKLLWENLKRAQILADTFTGRWKDGIPLEDFKAAWSESGKYSADLEYLMDGTLAESGGLTEPLAVGSSRVWADRNARNLMLVVDVGAGTTDLSLFWIVQQVVNGGRRAFPVLPSSHALRMAGDLVDDILLKHILQKVHGHPDDLTRRRIEAGLRRRGMRRIKEQMLSKGTTDVALVTDQVVTLNRAEFCSSDQMEALKGEFRNAIATFLSKVDVSWANAPDAPLLVLTGGSAALPFFSELADEQWTIAGENVRFRKARSVPQRIADDFDPDFQREYPQLAVAVGGVLPLLDERSMLTEWMGGAGGPGQLERYAVTGN
jgi:hypothetical protein